MADLTSADNLSQQIKILERRIDNLTSRAKPYIGGAWKATAVTQGFAQATGANIILNTVVTTPNGITNNGNGTWTVNVTGNWAFLGLYDLAAPAGPFSWIITVATSGGQTICADQFYNGSNAFSQGSAYGELYVTAGTVILFSGVWYGPAGTNYGVATNRTLFNARLIN